ncbi:DMT family transporter [Ornithinibacillus californiensis]|uniref:DMT family transporter n=1 Tax=Ornithinibacillus californiensis TaxID=161536 RepID=UPI00064DF36D|nr:DMT family transporter [Ornithinibacillus californiensis]
MKALLVLLTLSLLWGSSFLWTKQLLVYFEPATLVFFRCIFGLIALVPFWLRSKGKIQFRVTIWFLLIISLAAAIPWTIVSISLTSLDTSIAGILNATTPVLGLLLSVWILHDKPNRNQVVGIIIGLLAVLSLLLFSGQASNAEFSFIHALLVLVATSCYALNSILVKKFYPTITALQLGMWTLGIAAVCNGIVSVVQQPQAILALGDPEVWGSLIVLGCLGSGLAYVLFYYLVMTASPVFALLTTFIIPFITILLGVSILGEPFHLGIRIGLPLMIVSLIVMNIKRQREVVTEEVRVVE